MSETRRCQREAECVASKPQKLCRYLHLHVLKEICYSFSSVLCTMAARDKKAHFPVRAGCFASCVTPRAHLWFTFLYPPTLRFQLFCPAGPASQLSSYSLYVTYLSLSLLSLTLQNFTEPLNNKDDDSLVSKEGVKHGQCSLCYVLLWFFNRLARGKFVIAMPKPPSFLRGLQQQCLKQKTSQVRKETQDKCRDFLVFLPDHFLPALPFCSH